MDVKQAVQVAKTHLQLVFESELTDPPSLEEVWFDGSRNQWCVTLGINRQRGAFATIKFPDYKTVRIDALDASLVSIRNREIAPV